MARFKDVDWNLDKTSEGRARSWNEVHTAVLMDIRDELKRLNRLLHCSNFIGIPHTLTAIRQNTTKKRRVRRRTTERGTR
jgi:hypothetical protein